MAGAVINWEFDELQALQGRIDQLTDFQRAELAQSLSAEGESQTRRRLSEEKKDPSGKRWEPLSEDWKRRKQKKSSGGLLEYQGHLIDSIAGDPDGDTAAWGTNLVYGAIQHFGGEEVGRPGHPAREYLGLSSANEQDMLAIANDFLNDALNV